MNSVGIDAYRKRSHMAALDGWARSSCRGGSSTTRRRSWRCWKIWASVAIALKAIYGWEWLCALERISEPSIPYGHASASTGPAK